MSRYATTSSSARGDRSIGSNYHYESSSRSRYDNRIDSTRHEFSVSDSDFQRDAVLKRQRYLSSERTTLPTSSSFATHRGSTTDRSRDCSRDRSRDRHSSNSHRHHNHSHNHSSHQSNPRTSSSSQLPHRDSRTQSSRNHRNHNNSRPASPQWAAATQSQYSPYSSAPAPGTVCQAAVAAVAAAAAAAAAASSTPLASPPTVDESRVLPAASAPTPAVAAPAQPRGKSKSRARRLPAKPTSNSEFIPLGARSQTVNPYKATFYSRASDRLYDSRPITRSRSRSIGVRSTATTAAPQPPVTVLQPPSPQSTMAAAHKRAASSSRRSTALASASTTDRGRTRERDRERTLAQERAALPAPSIVARSNAPKHAEAKASTKRSKSAARSHKATRRSRSWSNSSDNSSDSDDRSIQQRTARSRSHRASSKAKAKARKSSAKRTASSSSSDASDSDSASDPSPPPRARRGQSKSRHRSQSKAKAARTTPTTRTKSKSKSRAAMSSSTNSSTAIDDELTRTQAQLAAAKDVLADLLRDLNALTKRIDTQKYAIRHLELDLEVVEKRKRIEHDFHTRAAAATSDARRSTNRSTNRSTSRARPPATTTVTKRPCIVDTSDSDDDSDVVILDAVQVKCEPSAAKRPRRAASKSKSRARTLAAAAPPPPLPSSPMASPLTYAVHTRPTTIPDHFWGTAETAKLLVQHRVKLQPDGHVRKMRHLAFNPMKSDYFATASDDGGVIMWNYDRPTHDVAKVASFSSSSFRHDAACPESIAWSPDGNRLALAFRDPIDHRGAFCVVRLHNMELSGSDEPQDIPRDRVTSMVTTLHAKGISAIDWLPTGSDNHVTSRRIVTAGMGADHTVVLWDERDEHDFDPESPFKWKMLHREHRSEVRAICVHSQRTAVFTAGLDGQVIRFDLQKSVAEVVLTRRKPTISKLNAVLEHPHNPHVLLVSSVDAVAHNLLLHDLRMPQSQSTMTLSSVKPTEVKSMSQYVVPRWSPAGMHVSCGTPSGLVNIWDVRVRGPRFPLVLPQQSIKVHQKSVLHATWHPRYDALFCVSNDRQLGLMTFR